MQAVATIFTYGIVMGVQRKDDVVKGRQRFEVGENVKPKTSRARATATGAPTTSVTTTTNEGRLEYFKRQDRRAFVCGRRAHKTPMRGSARVGRAPLTPTRGSARVGRAPLNP